MDNMSLLSLLLISMPEAVLITMLGFQLTGLKTVPLQLFLIGSAQTVVSYFIRLSPLPFGLHSLVQVAVYILILRVITGIQLRAVIITAFLGLTIYASLETVLLPALAGITNYSLKEIITGDTLRVTFFLPEAILILILIFACKRYNFQLLNFSSSSNTTA